jgi:hypothetical protein
VAYNDLERAIMFNRRINLPEDELRDLYLNQGLTMAEIAARFNVGATSVRRKLHEMGVVSRPRGPKGSRESAQHTLTSDELRELYIERKLSIPQIAELYGCANETIRQRLIKHAIPIRSFSQATLVQHGTGVELRDFDGDEKLRAYMIGFRLGDLTVRRPKPSSEILYLDGSSSKEEQIKLIKALFSPYGHIVTWSQRRLTLLGIVRYELVRITLNESFKFLLDKPTRVPSWILAVNQYFLSFFGGFTDAEGSFHIRQHKEQSQTSRYSLKNTDKEILVDCREKLIALGIQCSALTKVYDAGRQTSKRGVFATKALYGFNVEQKESLLRLIALLTPFVRHEKRGEDMERVRENVEWRNSVEFQDEVTRKRVASMQRTMQVRIKKKV